MVASNWNFLGSRDENGSLFTNEQQKMVGLWHTGHFLSQPAARLLCDITYPYCWAQNGSNPHSALLEDVFFSTFCLFGLCFRTLAAQPCLRSLVQVSSGRHVLFNFLCVTNLHPQTPSCLLSRPQLLLHLPKLRTWKDLWPSQISPTDHVPWMGDCYVLGFLPAAKFLWSQILCTLLGFLPTTKFLWSQILCTLLKVFGWHTGHPCAWHTSPMWMKQVTYVYDTQVTHVDDTQVKHADDTQVTHVYDTRHPCIYTMQRDDIHTSPCHTSVDYGN